MKFKIAKGDEVKYGDKNVIVITEPYENGLVWIEFIDTKENRLVNSKDLI